MHLGARLSLGPPPRVGLLTRHHVPPSVRRPRRHRQQAAGARPRRLVAPVCDTVGVRSSAGFVSFDERESCTRTPSSLHPPRTSTYARSPATRIPAFLTLVYFSRSHPLLSIRWARCICSFQHVANVLPALGNFSVLHRIFRFQT